MHLLVLRVYGAYGACVRMRFAGARTHARMFVCVCAYVIRNMCIYAGECNARCNAQRFHLCVYFLRFTLVSLRLVCYARAVCDYAVRFCVCGCCVCVVVSSPCAHA